MRSNSWRSTIVDQRKPIALAIKATPSLRTVMRDPDWGREDIWLDARSQGREKENGLGGRRIARSLPLDDGAGSRRSGLLAGVKNYSGQNLSSIASAKLHGQRAGKSASSNSVSIAAFEHASGKPVPSHDRVRP